MVHYAYFPQNAIRIFPETVAQGIADGVDKVITRRDNLEKQIAINTLPSKYWPSEFDIGAHLRDETYMEFVKWRMAGEEDQTVEYVESLPTRIFAIPTEGKPVFYNKGGLTIAYAEGIFNFRDTGKLASKAYDSQRHIIDFMRSPLGYEFAVEHSDLLSKAPNIGYIVIGKLPHSPNAVYGVAQLSEDTALFFSNIDSYKMIDKWASREGIATEDLILRAIGEEFAHLVRRGKATVQEEIDVRNWLIDLYSTLANKSLDSKDKERYQKIVGHLEKDLATVRQRYSKTYSRNIERLVDMYTSDTGKLELILESEARLEYGSSDKGKIAEYVSGRLEEIAKAVEVCEGKEDVDYGSKESVEDAESTEAEACAETSESNSTDGNSSEGSGEGGE